jgi:2-phospho-L-lactate/phosphoenolpyruvate guanylyltransferase
MILIPVKHLARAKQRLAAWFDQEARTQLAQTMLLDVCETVAQICDRMPISLVTSDPFAIELAQRFHFEVMSDHDNPGETEAIARATRVCVARGAESTLVIPGDIPLITVPELEQILAAAPSEGTVLVPDAAGRGTNAAFRRPADLFPLSFGNDSFKPHLAAAHTTGMPCVTLTLPGIALDVDNPSNLRDLAAAPGETRSQRLIQRWNLEDLPQAASE